MQHIERAYRYTLQQRTLAIDKLVFNAQEAIRSWGNMQPVKDERYMVFSRLAGIHWLVWKNRSNADLVDYAMEHFTALIPALSKYRLDWEILKKEFGKNYERLNGKGCLRGL